MKKVRIENINTRNWYQCCMLKPFDYQNEFVLSNSFSLAQSKFEPTLKPIAIYFNDEVVGFAMYNTEKEELDAYWIYRIMIDQKYQKLGIAKEAMLLLIDEIKKNGNCKKIALGYDKENYQAENLYESIGFKHKGHFFGNEKAVILEI